MAAQSKDSDQEQRLRRSLESFGPNGERWGHKWPHGGPCAWTACIGTDIAEFVVETAGFKDYEELWAWNDAPERTFAEVKALFEKAIAKAVKS